MASKAVLIACLVVSLTEKSFQTVSSSTNTSELTRILTNLQQHLSPSSCDSLVLLTQVLVREIEGRVEQRSEFASRITELQNQVTTRIAGPTVAFSAQATIRQTALTTQQKINFQTVVTNLGGGYNADISTFRCPVRGVYQFIVTILSLPNDRLQTELIAAGVSRMLIYSSGVTYFGSGSNSVLLELQAGDEVYVRLYLSEGTQLHQRWSTFNGHLVKQL